MDQYLRLPITLLVLVSGCGNDGGQGGSESGECFGDTGGESLDGAWAGVEDWTDPGPPGNEAIADACGWASQDAHHCFSTAIHAVHMHTGEILLFHGERDQRVWKIGTFPEAIEWHPNLLRVQHPTGATAVPDMFCAGQVQLADGRVFTAGGNITGGATAGGLLDTFIFDPVGAIAATAGQAGACSFGWQGNLQGNGFVTSTTPTMEHDRWYPTLTMLRDGRILISGGYSWIEGLNQAAAVDPETCGPGTLGCACLNAPADPCAGSLECIDGICLGAQRSPLLEVYDPISNGLESLTNAPFPVPNFPIYPQMFLLPNGDVFYAGSEDATNDLTASGWFLVIDYDAPPSQWTWSAKMVASDVTGGSAVMYAPGVILKTGGPRLVNNGAEVSSAASNRAERIDLSGFPVSGNYDGAPSEFSDAEPMNHARHFHNLVVLPNGNVLAVGGNSYGNGSSRRGENPNFPCELNDQRVDEIPCETGCPSVCVDMGSYYDPANECGVRPENHGCSLITLVPCEMDAECEAVLAGSACVGTRCFKACSTDSDCGTLEGTEGQCAPGLESPQFPGRCDPGNNACYATRNAEIYDPECDVWVELDAEQYPRMYHSTALLLPDGRVLSMGGGHRGAVADQPVSEYFVPRYSTLPDAPRPSIDFGGLGDVGTTAKPLLPYGGMLNVNVSGPSAERFTLIRLGSTTHGFDQDQRFLELSFAQSNGVYTIQGPSDGGQAPPGHYMLFAISTAGQPSVGRYVRVGVGR